MAEEVAKPITTEELDELREDFAALENEGSPTRQAITALVVRALDELADLRETVDGLTSIKLCARCTLEEAASDRAAERRARIA